MSLLLTPEILRLSYEYLDATQPFVKWNLPHGDDVKFKVAKDPALRGWYTFDGVTHTIVISSTVIGTTKSLLETMAHEMIHLHEQDVKICRGDVEHSTAFKRLAAKVCQSHGFDPKLF